MLLSAATLPSVPLETQRDERPRDELAESIELSKIPVVSERKRVENSFRKAQPEDISRVLFFRILGAYAKDGNVKYRRPYILVSSAVVAVLLIWSVVEAINYSSQDAFTRFLRWCFYYVLLIVSVFPVLHAFSQLFIRMSGSLDRILTDRGRAAYKQWAQSALHPVKQFAVGISMAIAAPLLLWLVDRIAGPGTKVLVLPPSYAIVSIAGFLCGCAAHLLIGMASFTALITKPRHSKLYPILPARTPAIEEVSQITIAAFVGSAIYSVLLLAPFVYWTYDLNLNSPDDAESRSVYFMLKLALIGACSIAALAVGLLPQIHISVAIQGTRRTTMLALLRRLKSNPRAVRSSGGGNDDHGNDDDRLHDLFARVANSPISTLGSSNIVEISVGVVAALLPLAVTVILH